MKQDLVFPRCSDDKKLANDIGTPFIGNTEKIRSRLDSITSTDDISQPDAVNTYRVFNETEA